MKIRLFFLMLTCSCFCMTTYAQKLNIQWGKKHRVPTQASLQKVIGATGKGVYALRYNGGDLLERGFHELEAYSTDMNLQFVKKIDPQIGKKRARLIGEDAFLVGNRILFLSSYFHSDIDEQRVYAHWINEQGKFEGKHKIVSSIKTKTRLDVGDFYFDFSPDSSYMVILYKDFLHKGRMESIHLSVVDRDMNKVWSKKYNMPYKKERVDPHAFVVDEAANVYLTAKLDHKDGILFDPPFNAQPDYFFTIFSFFNSGKNVKEYRLTNDDTFITDLFIKASKEGVSGAGFYTERRVFNAKGTVFFRINPDTDNTQAVVTGKSPFDLRFIRQFEDDIKVKRQGELNNFKIADLVLRGDGGVVVIAEQQYVQEQVAGPPSGRGRPVHISYDYHFHDVILINLNPDGAIAWATKVPKRQITVDDEGFYSSVALAVVRDKLYLIYNDHIKNLLSEKKRKRKRTMTNPFRSITTITAVDLSGNSKQFPMFSGNEIRTITRPLLCKQVSKNEIIIYGEKHRDYKFGRVVFQ